LIVYSGSSGAADRRWFQKAPRFAAASISERFATIAPEKSFRFNSGFGQPDAPCALRPSAADAEFIDFTVLFDVASWHVLTDATPSAESQILSAILALQLLDPNETSTLKRRCSQLGIPLVSTSVDDPPEPEPLADFDPKSRDLLNNDIFWNSTDEYTPAGNDTGADLLWLYRQWRVDNSPTDRSRFFDDILSQWELSPLAEIPHDDLARRLQQSHYEILTWDDTVIAWAVAQLACDGNLDADIARLAVTAIDRQSSNPVVSFRGWTSVSDRLSVLNIVRDTLNAAPNTNGGRSGE